MEQERITSDIRITLEGDTHSVKAGTFVTALAADLQVLSSINEALSKGDYNIDVRVAAPERGSFEFLIEVIGFGVTVPALFGYDGLNYIQQLVSTYRSLHDLIRFLGGEVYSDTLNFG